MLKAFPSRQHWRISQRQLVTILAAFASFLVVLFLMEEFLDRPIARYFQSLQGTYLVGAASYLTDFGKAHWFLVPAVALYLAFRFVWRRPVWASQALFFFVAVAVAGLLTDVLKFPVGRARPKLFFRDDLYQFFNLKLGADYYSFPSGHAACAIAAGFAGALLFPRYRGLSVMLGVALASTRFITNAHFLSDVVASAALTIIVVLGVWAAFARYGVVLSSASSQFGRPAV